MSFKDFVEKLRSEGRLIERNADSYTCPYCKDDGFITYRNEDGYDVSMECECSKRKRLERKLRKSGITLGEFESKTLDSFKADNPEAAEMKSMAVKYLGDPKALGIGYFGKSGTGKTHICIAICQEFMRNRGVDCRYFSYRADMQKLLRSYYEDSYWQQVDELCAVPVLYIDDLLKFAKSARGEVLESELRIAYDIINTRYINKRRTIFSSEYTVNEILDIDEALGSRIYSMVKPYGMKCEGKNRRIVEC